MYVCEWYIWRVCDVWHVCFYIDVCYYINPGVVLQLKLLEKNCPACDRHDGQHSQDLGLYFKHFYCILLCAACMLRCAYGGQDENRR